MDQTTRWCHYKDMLTALMAFCEGNPLGTGGFPSQWVNAPRKDQWRGALLISLMCASTTGWTNSQDAGDLKRHDAHCDVTVMSKRIFGFYLKVNCSVRTTLFIFFFIMLQSQWHWATLNWWNVLQCTICVVSLLLVQTCFVGDLRCHETSELLTLY